MRLAVVVSRWGEPTQTFVWREADAARRAGHDVVALSIKRPRAMDGSIPTVHLRPAEVVLGAARAILTHPVLTGRALARAVAGSGVRNLAPTIAAWAVGSAWSVRAPEVDWIHAHFAWVGATAGDALAAARRQPFSVFAHAHDIFEHRLADGYTRDKLRRAAFVLVEADRIAAEVRERFDCNPEVQRMGVPSSIIVDTPQAPTGRRVVSVGSLLPKKGHDDLVRAVAQLEECELEIIGEGPLRAELEQLAVELGCSNRVRLLGAVDPAQVLACMRGAAAFCLASKPTTGGDRDGVPNVLIEAMATGIPVISTDLSGIPDLVTPDRGIVVAPGSVAALTNALRTCLDDPAASLERAKAALDHVRECYTTERNWEILERRINAHSAR